MPGIDPDKLLEDHDTFIAGWLFGHLWRQGIKAEPLMDDDGYYMDEFIIDTGKAAGAHSGKVRVKVLGWED